MFEHYYLSMFRLFVKKNEYIYGILRAICHGNVEMARPQRKLHYLKLHCSIQIYNIMLIITFSWLDIVHLN